MPGLTVGSRWFYLKQILYYISTAFFFKISSPLFRALYLLTVAPNFKTVRTVSNTIYFLWLQSRGGGGGAVGEEVRGVSVFKCMRGTNE